MFQTLVKAFKIKEVRRKILITFALIIVYRIGCYIPIPGLGKGLFEDGAEGFNSFTYLQIMNAMTGSALQYGTLFAMGIGPYINASIIVQLLTVAIPPLERLTKQGEEGQRKISNITRIVTLILAVLQAVGILIGFKANIQFDQLFGENLKWLGYIFLVVIYTAGAALTMWIGERITDYGVSNGISMLIFAGIIATAGQAIISLFRGNDSQMQFWQIIIFVVFAIIIFAAIVTVDGAERKIPVQYAKQVKGRKMYGGQSTHIPIKVNSSGVMPLIFAFAILSFPDLIINLVGVSSNNWYSQNMGTGSWLNTVVMCLLILAFAYFYNAIQFKPDDISRSIQQNGGFIPGTRPGKPTTDYLKRVSNRITLFGAVYLALVALIPSLVFKAINPTLTSAFSATGLLIVVSVALEFNQALESQIMMKNYKGFLK